MRFLVISDIHGRDRVIDWANRVCTEIKADGILVLGDITQFGPSEWAGKFLERLNTPSYAIPGNCDPPEVIEWIEKKATSLHERKMKLAGRTVVGLGGSNPTIFHTPFEMQEEVIEEKLKGLMEEGAVLVTHTPPFGINDLVPSRRHVGSTAMKSIVERFKPKIVLSGHVHEASGIVRKEGALFMNPGAAKDARAGILELGEECEARLLENLADY